MRASLLLGCVSFLLATAGAEPVAVERPLAVAQEVAADGDEQVNVPCYSISHHMALPDTAPLKTDRWAILVRTHGLQSGLEWCAEQCSKIEECRGVSVEWTRQKWRPYKCTILTSEKTGQWWGLEASHYEAKTDNHMLARLETPECFPGLADAKRGANNLQNTHMSEWHKDRMDTFLQDKNAGAVAPLGLAEGDDDEVSVPCYTIHHQMSLPATAPLKTDRYAIYVRTIGHQSGLEFCAKQCTEIPECRGVSVEWTHQRFRPYKCNVFTSEKTGQWWSLDASHFEAKTDNFVLARRETQECFPGLEDAKRGANNSFKGQLTGTSHTPGLQITHNPDWHEDRVAAFLKA